MGIWYAYKNITKTGIKPYAGSCPPYYDLKGTVWADKLMGNLGEIQAKTICLLNGKGMELQQYYNATLVEEGEWESSAFLVWNMSRRMPEGAQELMDFFAGIPGLVSLSISVLQPNTHLKPHSGDTDATFRVHIPVVIPDGLPACGIKVAGISREWTPQTIVAFCDAYLHEAWNRTNKTRIVLIADVIRPEFLSSKRMICANVLSWLFVQQVFQLKVLNILPGVLKKVIGFTAFAGALPLFFVLQRRRAYQA